MMHAQPSLFTGADLPGWQFGDLQPFSAGVIACDPALRFLNWSKKGEDRNASQHYETMDFEEILALRVGELASEHCALLLWMSGPFANRWPETMVRWGFKFSGKAFCWAKPNERDCGSPVANICDDKNWFMGLGYGSRHNTEDCWLGIRGSPRRLNANVRELIVAPLREHSRKPDEFYARAERLFAGPYVELFSRAARPGWSAWGREAGKFDSNTTGVTRHAARPVEST